jgi:hypothetical protein
MFGKGGRSERLSLSFRAFLDNHAENQRATSLLLHTTADNDRTESTTDVIALILNSKE